VSRLYEPNKKPVRRQARRRAAVGVSGEVRFLFLPCGITRHTTLHG